MAAVDQSGQIYFLTISLIPQKEGLDVPQLVKKISDKLVDDAITKIVHKFKVLGEARVIAVVQVTDVRGLEQLTNSLFKLGPLDITSQPGVAYEDFAKNMKVTPELCVAGKSCLQRSGIVWLEFNIEYHGQSFEGFLEIWKKEAETVLSKRKNGEANIELIKCLATRRVQVLLNAPDYAGLDLLSFQLPLMTDNGANISINSRGVQYLDDFVDSLGYTAI